MSVLHRLADVLKRGQLPESSATAQTMLTLPGTGGALISYGTTKPTDGGSGYAVGHIFIKTNGATNTMIYINAGSATSCTFKRIDEVAGASTLAVTGLLTASAGINVPTGQTAAVVDADKLTVGGVIVPQRIELVHRCSLHASKVIDNIFNAPYACEVTNISYTVNVAQAITATLVKSTVNATPASATTPLHIAGAINANTTVHNGTIVTLTVTGADLILAATDKIGIVLSGALTSGDFTVNLSLKRK
jgi:hypothetical protein